MKTSSPPQRHYHRLVCGLAAMLVVALSTTEAPAQSSKRPENFPANPKLPSLFLIGDSTVRNGTGTGTGGQWGWGDWLAPFFDTNQINVVNRALGGTQQPHVFIATSGPHVTAMLKRAIF